MPGVQGSPRPVAFGSPPRKCICGATTMILRRKVVVWITRHETVKHECSDSRSMIELSDCHDASDWIPRGQTLKVSAVLPGKHIDFHGHVPPIATVHRNTKVLCSNHHIEYRASRAPAARGSYTWLDSTGGGSVLRGSLTTKIAPYTLTSGGVSRRDRTRRVSKNSLLN